MKIIAQILSATDITTATKDRDGRKVTTGQVKLLCTDPSQIIDVAITEEQVAAGYHASLKTIVGKGPTEFMVEYRSGSFGDDNNRHRSYNGFRLVDLPASVQAKA
ncbi:hypothetical protein [Aeromonas caviae]